MIVTSSWPDPAPDPASHPLVLAKALELVTAYHNASTLNAGVLDLPKPNVPIKIRVRLDLSLAVRIQVFIGNFEASRWKSGPTCRQTLATNDEEPRPS
eukprot:952604-Rhodomonas_salina.2